MPYLEDVLPEEPEATFDPESDILEIIGNDQPGGGDTFSLEAGEATLVYLIDWLKARSFLRWCLGFSYADEGYPYKLRRENPQFHPRFPWLTAGTAHLSSVAPESGGEDAIPANTPNFPAVLLDGEGITKTGRYQKCYATVRFVDRPWVFRPDGYITDYVDEIERNTTFLPVPSVEMLSAEGPLGQMRWTETGADGPSIIAPNNLINTPFGTLVGKTTFNMTWWWVPEEYLSNKFVFSPDNILRCVAHVNSLKIGPWGPGTVMAMPPKFERFRFPVSTFDGLFPFFGYNVTVPFVHFQPRPRGTSAAAAADIALAADPTNPIQIAAAEAEPDGYRLLPWPRSRKWYPAKRSDGTSYLFPETDLAAIFRHVAEPA
jgi:hypothetical protein